MGSRKISQLYQHVSLLLQMHRKQQTVSQLQLVFFDLTKAYDVINHDIHLEN
jgi:hypothetical protein